MGDLPSHEEFEQEHAARHPEPDPDCFACRISTVSLQFTYGKAEFHGPTIKERADEHHKANAEQGRKLGRDYESASRWV